MFTGIIQNVGTIAGLRKQGAGARLEVRAGATVKRLKRGDSIAVNGCCLTIVARRDGVFAADLTRETLDRTALGQLGRGSRVNLEAPLRAGDPLGGHLLQGHVEATGKLIGLTSTDKESGWWLELEAPDKILKYLAPKGSLAVDGISLTIAAMNASRVGFAIIPYTYRHTHLSHLRPGAAVNLETDPLARHLERLLEARAERAAAGSELTEAGLLRQGF